MYLSTRGNGRIPASKAILKGLADDGGLFVPEKISKLNLQDIENKDYVEILKDVLVSFLDDFSIDEINYCIDNAYNEKNFKERFCRVKNFNGLMFLELYHGPTLAFKDMALTILPYLIEVAKKKNGVKDKSLVLVATSGDTGGATLSSFKKMQDFETVVLYPNGGVAEIQEKQMLYFTGECAHAYAVDGNFDDCQTFVKEVFKNYPKDNGVIPFSANSINIGRLIPQVAYYVFAYAKAVKKGYVEKNEKFNICVPTGNFGDIFAGYLAKEMGVPIDKLICASNENSVLTDFFKSGIYNKNRKFVKTNSPAMDILISSNLERLVYYVEDKNAEKVSALMEGLAKTGEYEISDGAKEKLSSFMACSCSQEQTLKSIKEAFLELNYLIDPHTAVAYYAYKKLNVQEKTLIVSTASAYKFASTMCTAFNLDLDKGEFELAQDLSKITGTKVPKDIKKLNQKGNNRIVKTKEEILKEVLFERDCVEVRVPCSTANLGCLFDCAGIAFNKYNTFKFKKSDKDKVDYGKVEDNLILKAYRKVFEVANKPYLPVEITTVENGVPFSSGLGSSATCIVAGVIAGNAMLKDLLTKDQLLNVMTQLEGHPDNVAPAFLGGLVLAVNDGGEVLYVKNSVNRQLKFYAITPNYTLSTKTARKALSQTVSLSDAVNNISRALITPEAFKSGNIKAIKTVFKDKIHQNVRINLIKGGKELKCHLESLGYAVAISGAGPSLLAVGDDKTAKLPDNLLIDEQNFKVIKLKVDNKGAKAKLC